VTVQAFDAYEFERMTVPAAAWSDFVAVNLFRSPGRHADAAGCGQRPGLCRGPAGRDSKGAPAAVKPELAADGPDQVEVGPEYGRKGS
jgi:hypothetical protein